MKNNNTYSNKNTFRKLTLPAIFTFSTLCTSINLAYAADTDADGWADDVDNHPALSYFHQSKLTNVLADYEGDAESVDFVAKSDDVVNNNNWYVEGSTDVPTTAFTDWANIATEIAPRSGVSNEIGRDGISTMVFRLDTPEGRTVTASRSTRLLSPTIATVNEETFNVVRMGAWIKWTGPSYSGTAAYMELKSYMYDADSDEKTLSIKVYASESEAYNYAENNGWYFIEADLRTSKALADVKIRIYANGNIKGASLFVDDIELNALNSANLDGDLDGDAEYINAWDDDDDGDTILDGVDTNPLDFNDGPLVDLDKDGIIDGYDDDLDNDGISNPFDAFPLDAFHDDDTETLDFDNDGVGNNSDAFPNDIAASLDTDGDGYPDSWNAGKNAIDSTSVPVLSLDAFPNDASKHSDGQDDDKDGIENSLDAFPNDGAASIDSDADGLPDSWNAGKSAIDSTSDPVLSLDAFPNDRAASIDSDGDGYPDSWNVGKSAADSSSDPVLSLDAFPNDIAASIDTDGDGYPDSWNVGKSAADSSSDPVLSLDAFPSDADRHMPNFTPTVTIVADADTVEEGAAFTLTAQGSDADGDDISYLWEQISGPDVVVSDLASATLEFTAPELIYNAQVEFKVTVSDGKDSASATTMILVNDKPEKSSGGSMNWLLLLTGFGVLTSRLFKKGGK